MDINGYWVDYLVDTDDIIHPWHVAPVGTFLLSILPSIRCHWSTPTPPVPIFACLLDCLRKGIVVILKVARLGSMEGHQKSQSWPYSCASQCVQRICPKHFGENIGSLANLLLSAFTREDVQHRDANCHGRLDSNYELFNVNALISHHWLVVEPPLWKMMEWKSVGKTRTSQYIESNKIYVPNHQTVYMCPWQFCLETCFVYPRAWEL